MKKAWLKKFGLVFAFFVVLYVGRQWVTLDKMNRSPEAAWRAGVRPSELAVSAPLPGAVNSCDLGYASFSLPGDPSVNLVSSEDGTMVKGSTAAFQFACLPPFDPSIQAGKLGKSDDDPETLRKALAKYSNDPSLTFDTFLDFEIDLEKTMPRPLWRCLLMSPAAFNMYASKLLTKSSLVGMGMRGVYTFETAHTRGLIRVGGKRNDTLNAHIAFVSRDGKQAVGMHLSCLDAERGNVMDFMPVIVKSFQFTGETVPKKDDLKALITAAGIPPEPEKTEPPPAEDDQ